jgi:hypothetical protein
MNTVIILGCGAKKQDVICAARHLYTGPLSQAALAYALKQSDERSIRILSAKYGLVNLDTKLAPYDQTWSKPGCIDRTELATQMPFSWGATDFILLCGAHYRDALFRAYEFKFHKQMHYTAPLQHLGIGQQLKWLKDNTP